MTPLRRRPLAGIAALAAAAALAGCGGGGSDSLGADEFREQADAICADSDERIATLTEPTAADQILPFLQAGLPIQADELERFGDLEPPEELRAGAGEIQELNQQRQDLIQQAADRIEGGEDPEAVIAEVNPEIDALQAQARGTAGELGLAVCGRSSDEPATTAPATAGTAPEAPAAPPSETGETGQFVTDVRAAASALQAFGTLLQGTTSLEDLRSKVPEAREQLDAFDAAIDDLRAYSLEAPALENQRSGLAATGPAVGDVLRRFVDAAEAGDTEAVQSLVPEVTQAISDFQQAATATP